MTRVVGVAIARDSVRAVLVRRGRILWAGETLRPDASSLAGPLEALLAKVPRSVRRPIVSVAIGPHAAQLKRIEGLPPVSDPDLLSALVRESPGAFFLRNGVPLTTTGVQVEEPGVGWAAAIDTPLLEEVRETCGRFRLVLRVVVPSAAVLPTAVRDRAFAWRDGSVVQEVVASGAAGGLVKARRVPASNGAELPPPALVAPLETMGADAWRFAEAYAAATAGPQNALAVGPTGAPVRLPNPLLTAIRTPLLVSLIAVVALTASPLAAVWSAARSEASLRALHGSEGWQAMEAALLETGPVTAALDEIDAFQRGRSRPAVALAAFARTLPPGSALLAVSVGGGEGEAAIVTPQPDEVLAALRAAGFIGVEELTRNPYAPVSGEMQGLQRVRLRFKLPDGSDLPVEGDG